MFSKNIEVFLDFLRETVTQYNMADTAEAEANDLTQDLLHQIELQEHSYHEFAALSKELKVVREERRKAKDTKSAATPIVGWIENNRQTIKDLERLLGDVRKAERSSENRIYTPRAKKAR